MGMAAKARPHHHPSHWHQKAGWRGPRDAPTSLDGRVVAVLPLHHHLLPAYLFIPGQSLLGQVEFGVSGGSVGPRAPGKPAIQILCVLPRKQEREVRGAVHRGQPAAGGGPPTHKRLIGMSSVSKPRGKLSRINAKESRAPQHRKILARRPREQGFKNLPAKLISHPLSKVLLLLNSTPSVHPKHLAGPTGSWKGSVWGFVSKRAE